MGDKRRHGRILTNRLAATLGKAMAVQSDWVTPTYLVSIPGHSEEEVGDIRGTRPALPLDPIPHILHNIIITNLLGGRIYVCGESRCLRGTRG